MYEGKFQIPAQAQGGEGTALRAFAWAELTARLNVARELRRELRQESAIGGASFTDAAAAYFASIDSEKPTVNHDALSDGNSDQCIAEFKEHNAAQCDREK